jgi:Tripartite tricarboxylate transporter family receptor
VLVPAGTAPVIIERLNAAILKGLAMTDARERLATLGGEVGGGSPEQAGGIFPLLEKKGTSRIGL